jgi:hypothetical protein
MLDLLEACSSLVGNFSLDRYRQQFPEPRELSPDLCLRHAAVILVILELIPPKIHPVLALAALSELFRPDASDRSLGVHHTDIRLAEALAKQAGTGISDAATVVDPAAGTGERWRSFQRGSRRMSVNAGCTCW